MKRIILTLVVLAFCGGCSRSNHREKELLALVKVRYKCDNVQIVAKGSGWRTLNVCGVKRFYEHGARFGNGLPPEK